MANHLGHRPVGDNRPVVDIRLAEVDIAAVADSMASVADSLAVPADKIRSAVSAGTAVAEVRAAGTAVAAFAVASAALAERYAPDYTLWQC